MTITTATANGSTASVIITWGGGWDAEPPPPAPVREPRCPLPPGPPVLAAVRAPDGTWEVP